MARGRPRTIAFTVGVLQVTIRGHRESTDKVRDGETVSVRAQWRYQSVVLLERTLEWIVISLPRLFSCSLGDLLSIVVVDVKRILKFLEVVRMRVLQKVT